MRVLVKIYIVETLIGICLSARILGYFPVASISHQVVYRALIEALAKRGHHIVVITPDPLGTDAPPHYENVTEIDVHTVSYAANKARTKEFDFYTYRENPDSYLFDFKYRYITFFDAQLSSPAVREFINNRNQTFDLVFGECLHPISFAFGAYFKAPYIGVSSLSGSLSNFEAVGSPSHPLLYPDIYRRYAGKLNFWQKILTLKTEIIQRYALFRTKPLYNELITTYFGQGIPSIDELENNMELLFINQHPILCGVRPTVPAVVYMGNIHIKPRKHLPKELKKILDESTGGVIYFSLGSNMLSKNLDRPKIKHILKAFSEMNYTVLWKFEDATLQKLPDNVHISKWFPQFDLLGHPNVKAFITQGGLQSMEEGIHNKVPFIGIPFVGDQDLNVQKMVELGIGVSLDITALTKENFKEAILEVAEGESYHKNIEKVSTLILDQPMTGLERAVWWTEYVMRHGGARHLRAPAADVPWHEYFMLDVLGPLLLCAVVMLLTLYLLIVKLVNVVKYITGRKKIKIN